ncbi:tannase/feruloyl esterase family alpha/beta hydrolase [Kordiimonas pumila]|uniref:Tannase/feruloyl esterase family alpha/beta hydrolase n=1 Tax=Kordiimonas pumila TaxID=2161677 RepID=A0ABV7D766_9PROT|nr:tannase/feruloyl esterase family alpha/beta hydrolase [Kordiimonas pumila]
MPNWRKPIAGLKQVILKALAMFFAVGVTITLPQHHAFANDATACSMIRFADFSTLDGGNAATSITSTALLKNAPVSEAESARTYRFSLMMGAPIAEGISELPEHCLIEGYVTPTIRFQFRLPVKDNWNGNYLMSSCDGFCGSIQTERTMAGIARNYATMTHDGGHTNMGFDGKWARNNLQGRIDFGHRANHVLAIAAKAIIKAYYGAPPQYSIIAGCSKGGQAGVMAAQRYPQDYDGVIARGPTVNYTKVNLISCMDNAKDALDENDQPIFDISFADFIKKAVMAACDETDGLKDGLISDPRQCHFDPATLLCGKTEGDKCLSAQQVTALKGLYAPSVDSTGKELYGALPYGSEEEWKGWVIPQQAGVKPYHYYAATEYMKYIAYPNALPLDANWRDFEYETEKNKLAEMSTVFDADNPDLREFRDRGGKMIVLHGWSDGAIPAYASIKWYEDVIRFMGGREKTAEFARMFLLPGVIHCGMEGPGPNTMDAITMLETWMAGGPAPESLLTSKIENGVTVRTRPVYPYPYGVKYKGKGDINKAENFKRIDPVGR